MNTFGPSSTQQYQIWDPRAPRRNRVRFRRDEVPELARANSFYLTAGRFPSRGWVLMEREDYDKVDRYSTSLQLCVDKLSPLKNLSVVQARCVTTGVSGDDSALYLVELTDDRGVLWNRWSQAPTTSAYNARSPAYPQSYYSGSLNSGVTWTWSTMVGDLWAQLVASGTGLLNAYPGLPSAPSGTPENWWFPGVPAWAALCDVLDHLGMVVACDLTSDSPFTIVSAGASDAAFTAKQALYLPKLEDDQEWVDLGAARVPKTVTVLFRKRTEHYGTEETVRGDSLQWSTSPFYSVSVVAPAQFASASGKHLLHDSFTVRHDINGAPLAADTATATAIAAERVTQYFGKIYSLTDGYMSQVYAGALPFTTGSQVDGVCWSQDYADQERQGWRTHIVRGPSPPWPQMWDDWME